MSKTSDLTVIFFTVLALVSLTVGPALAAPVTQSITYQGKLTNTAGTPLTGTYTVAFGLYNVSSGGTALGTDTHSVTAASGLFTTALTFNPAIVDGRALWLGIKVGTDPEMTPRQEIRPVPYALSLRPGGSIDGTGLVNTRMLTAFVSGTDSHGFDAYTQGYHNTGITAATSGDDSRGVYVTTTGNGGDGIRAVTSGSSSPGISTWTGGLNSPGVLAETSNDASFGVYVNTSGYGSEAVRAYTTGQKSGALYGNSAQDIGVYGIGKSGGVYGESAHASGIYGTSTDAPGVKGHSESAEGVLGESVSGYGVIGYSPNNVGVRGEGATYGVWARSMPGTGVYGASDTGYGVHGDSVSNYGVVGESKTGYGVKGSSTNNAGVYGESTSNHGVVGESESGFGVAGHSPVNYGVYGFSESNTGVKGQSNTGIGVSGMSMSPNGLAGVWGSGEQYGVRGESADEQGTPANGVGVSGKGKIGGSFTTNQRGTTAQDSAGVKVSTIYQNNPGILVDTASSGSPGVSVTTGGGSSKGVLVSTSGFGSRGVQVVTSGDNSDGVGVYTNGNNNCDGFFASTTGTNSDGIRVTTTGSTSHGVWIETTGPGSPGVYARTYGDESIGIIAISDLGYGVYGDGSTFGVYTPNRMWASRGYMSASGDIAEYMNVSKDVPPGTVLVIGKGGILQPSLKPYDTHVAGIISTAPGVSLGAKDSGNPGQALIAVAGKVPCNVDASNGPIEYGDLLTTSSRPGYAMKATDPKTGTVLGKAMGTLESGTGTIEVLVTLQ